MGQHKRRAHLIHELLIDDPPAQLCEPLRFDEHRRCGRGALAKDESGNHDRAAQQADYILFVVDAAEPCTEADTALAAELTRLETPIVLVRNKIDLTETRFTPPDAPFKALCDISALTGAGLERFEEQLTELLQGDAVMETNSPMLSRTHQKDSMRRASTCLDRLLANTAASPELSALELREALQALGEITGETTPEHLLDRIFASFCIGK